MLSLRESSMIISQKTKKATTQWNWILGNFFKTIYLFYFRFAMGVQLSWISKRSEIMLLDTKKPVGVKCQRPSKVFTAVKEFVNGVISRIKDMWTSIKAWFNSSVAPKLTLSYWKGKFSNIVSGLGAKLDEAWTKVKNFFSVSEWKKKVDDAVKAIKDNFKMPSLPKIRLEVSYDTNVGAVKTAIYEALGLDGWPNLRWSTYATGGFPSMGEMFIAREAGPELVGRINNRTAVANNDQIVEAVSAGVYSAVVAAMSAASGGGTQAVNVYLDSKQITASMEKRQMERGATLMTGGMVYGY